MLASSLAVIGAPPAQATDDTPPAPLLVYALHKRMAEQALETLARRGALDGLALRIPGVVARPGDGAGLKSAFLSRMFHAARGRQGIVLPVAATGRTWLASAGVVAAGMVHAAALPAGLPGARRSLLLPALAPSFAELAAALRAAFPGAPEPGWQPDPAVMAGFGSFGEIDATAARWLGFPADPDLASLIATAMAGLPGVSLRRG